MNKNVTWTLICLMISGNLVMGRVKRCFTCRSRGELGDCKDPFVHNSTDAEKLRDLEAAPCASGWCAKIVEGQKDSFDVATERICLPRPPGDSTERCDKTLYRHRRVFMCFCRGDLCNAGTSVVSKKLILLLLTGLLTFAIYWYI
ncbi:UPAR/Ly6 domain-containing protein rtv-like [Tachypleus tridentatus]|uniref:UPAR/Ly6 domain-containing protein rtv-like n=1 Tax=Tachypleus tridentatus TaxID=6853 RepID=UPI003FD29397